MRQVSEAAIVSSYTRLQQVPPARAAAMAQTLLGRQPALAAYVMASAGEDHSDAQELANWMLIVLQQAFEQTAGRALPRIKPAAIDRAEAMLEEQMLALEAADPRIQERRLGVLVERQPHVARYIIDTLLEPDPEDAFELDDDAIGILALVLATCAICLDRALAKALR